MHGKTNCFHRCVVACVSVSAFDIDRLSRLSERDEVYCRRLLFLPCVRVEESCPIELGGGAGGEAIVRWELVLIVRNSLRSGP